MNRDLEYEMVQENMKAFTRSCLMVSPASAVASLATVISTYSEKSGIPLDQIRHSLDMTVFAEED